MIASQYGSREVNLDPQRLADADGVAVVSVLAEEPVLRSEPAPVSRGSVPAAGPGLVVNPVLPAEGLAPQPVLFGEPAPAAPGAPASPRPAVASYVAPASGGASAEPAPAAAAGSGRVAAWAALGVLLLVLFLASRRRS